MARLFFAVWPDARAAAALERLAAELAVAARGKPVPAGKAHVTLAFLGEVPDARSGEACAAARGMGFEPFELRLDRVGSFRGARVAWAGSLEPAPELLALQGELGARLREAGFALEERAFTPHATIVRRIGRGLSGAAIEPIAWEVDAFRLVRTEPGTGRYVFLETFAGK